MLICIISSPSELECKGNWFKQRVPGRALSQRSVASVGILGWDFPLPPAGFLPEVDDRTRGSVVCFHKRHQGVPRANLERFV